MNTIFVYGTLMSGFENSLRYLERYVIERRTGFMPGVLYHLDYGYPAAIEGTGTVKGEICFVKDINDVLPTLDYLEKYNQPDAEDLYLRTIREVRDQHDNIILCYVYLWSPKRIDELTQISTIIKNGDWREFYNDLKLKNNEGHY